MNGDSERDDLRQKFLSQTDWAAARLVWLAQDASTRRYARLTGTNSRTAILMDAPSVEDPACSPEMSDAERVISGWNAQTRLAASRIDAFVLIADYLRQEGFRPPEIYAFDCQKGFALIEDFGPAREFARLIEKGDADEVDLYRRAACLLAKLHAKPAPKLLIKGSEKWPILTLDALALRVSTDLFVDWLPALDPRMTMNESIRAHWTEARDNLIDLTARFPRHFILRDFHAENLLLLENGEIGLLDFQDALLGWDAWDMAMLTQDARRSVSGAAEDAAIQSYLDQSGEAEADFKERLAVIGTLNALRIVGVFARLQVRDGKPRYGSFMPRQQWLLARNLKHPSVKAMRDFVMAAAPLVFETHP
jgi:aminoglycoside/choline kinase family phosphotransferase